MRTTERLWVSRTGMAHAPGCPHKDDPDLDGWRAVELTPHAVLGLLQAGIDPCPDCLRLAPWGPNRSTLSA